MKKWINVTLVSLLCLSPVDFSTGKQLIVKAVEMVSTEEVLTKFFVGDNLISKFNMEEQNNILPRFFKDKTKTDIKFDVWKTSEGKEIKSSSELEAGVEYIASFKPLKEIKPLAESSVKEGQQVVSLYVGTGLFKQIIVEDTSSLNENKFPKLSANLKGVIFDKWQLKEDEIKTENEVVYEGVFKFDKEEFEDNSQPMLSFSKTNEEDDTETETTDSETSDSESKDSESKDSESKDSESKDSESKDVETKDSETSDSERTDAETTDSETKKDKQTKAYERPEIQDKGWTRDPKEQGWSLLKPETTGEEMSKFAIIKGENEETGDRGLEYHYNFGGQVFQTGTNKEYVLSDIPAGMTGLFIKDLNTNQIVDSLFTNGDKKINSSTSGLYVHFYKGPNDRGPSETIHTLMYDSQFYQRTIEDTGITSLMAESKLVGRNMIENENNVSKEAVKETQQIPIKAGFKTPTGTAINETTISDDANLKVRSMISPDDSGRVHMAFALLNDGDKPITIQVSKSQDTALGGNDLVPIKTIENQDGSGKSMNGAAIEDNGYRLEFDFSSETGPESWLPRYDSLWRTPGIDEWTGNKKADDTGKAIGIVRSPVTKDSTNTPFPNGGPVIDTLGDGARIFYGYGNNNGIGDSRGEGAEAFVAGDGVKKTDPQGNVRDYGVPNTEFPRIGRSYSGISTFDLNSPEAYKTGDTGFQERWGVRTLKPGETYNGEYIINMESVHTNEVEYRNVTQQGEGDYPHIAASQAKETPSQGREETGNLINFKDDVIHAKNTVKLSPDMYKKASEDGVAIYLKNEAERLVVDGKEQRMLRIKLDENHPILMKITKPDGSVEEINLVDHLTEAEKKFIEENGYLDYPIGKNVPDGKAENRSDQIGLQYETYYYADVIWEKQAKPLLKSASRVAKYEGINGGKVETGATASGSVAVPIGNADGLDVKINGIPEFATSLGRLPKYVLAGKGTGIVMDVTPSGSYENPEYNWELSLKSGEVTATDTVIDPNNPGGVSGKDETLPPLDMEKLRMVIGGKFKEGKVSDGIELSKDSKSIMSRKSLTDKNDRNNVTNELTGLIDNNFGSIDPETGKYHGEFGGKAGNLVLSVSKDSIDWGSNYAMRQLTFPLEWSLELRKENGNKVEESDAVLPAG